MGITTVGITLLEKVVSQTKQAAFGIIDIVREVKRDNISTTVNLDTSITALTAVNISKLFEGGKVHNVTVLSSGGGLYLQTSLGEPFVVYEGDKIENEDIEILRWYGAGAGTATLRISGVR